MTRFALVTVAMLAATTARADNDPTAATARFNQGQKLYNLGKFPEAVAEFEAAYKLDADPVYLFALAQAYRLDAPKDADKRLANIERSMFFYRRYLELAPDATNRDEVSGRITALETERGALADKIAADKAAAAKLAAEQAAANPKPKRLRIAVDVGTSILYLVGDTDSRQSPQLTGRILVAYMRQLGDYTVDFGGSGQLTTLPYTATMTDGTERVSAGYTQLHAVVAITRTIAGPIWGRLGVGLGVSAFGNLKMGNPISDGGAPSTDIRMFCARADTVVGYRYNATIDFILGLGSASVSPRAKELDTRLQKVTTLEGFYVGVYLKL